MQPIEDMTAISKIDAHPIFPLQTEKWDRWLIPLFGQWKR